MSALQTLVERVVMSALCQKRTLCDAVKSPYWITSSAATRSVCGTVMPSSLAVLRLIISKYFTGICTGSSDGFAPRRILFTYWAERENYLGSLRYRKRDRRLWRRSVPHRPQANGCAPPAI